MFDVVILGSGPAGVSSALALSGLKVAVVDVGNLPSESERLVGNYYDLKCKEPPLEEEFIGNAFESLHNITKGDLMAKLKSPLNSYITKDHDRFWRFSSESLQPVVTYACGGLANIWGAQLYRYDENELADFPVTGQDLAPYYDRLTDHIGISGEEDDLHQFYGTSRGLMPPISLSESGIDLLSRYKRKRKMFLQNGIRIGRPRLAVLSRPHKGRSALEYDNLEFFRPSDRAVYSPRWTLEHLIQEKQITYCPGLYVENFVETERGVTVHVHNVQTGKRERLTASKLIIALGTIGSTRLVLQSRKDFTTRLPFLDNLVSYIPFLNLSRIGTPLEKKSFYTQLNLLYDGGGQNDTVMGTFYAITGILHSDLILRIPLPVRSNLTMAKYLFPAMFVLHLWYPAQACANNFIELRENGDISIQYQGKIGGAVEKHLIQVFRRIGYFSLPSQCEYPPPGKSFHYAGSLPMRDKPQGHYETGRDGRLSGKQHTYIVDGSVLPTISAKNHTFTIMANAMRIAAGVLGSVRN